MTDLQGGGGCLMSAIDEATVLLVDELAAVQAQRAAIDARATALTDLIDALSALSNGVPMGAELVTLQGAPELAAAMVEASQTPPRPATWAQVAAGAVTAGERQGEASTPGSPAPSKKKTSANVKWNYDEVAAVIDQGVENGLSRSKALVVRYGVSPEMAAYLVKQINKRFGAAAAAPAPTAPKPPPAMAPGATRGLVLECNDCDAEFDSADGTKLLRHTLSAHNRRPSKAERTPVQTGSR